MARRSSPAGLHTARAILKHYDLRVKSREEVAGNVSYIPTLRATEGHLSVMIDGVTGCKGICELREEWKYWTEQLHLGHPDPTQVLQFAKRIVEEFSKVPQTIIEESETVTAGSMMLNDARGAAALRLPESTLTISAWAKQAVIYICAFYHLTPRGKIFSNDWSMKMDVAKLIEISLGMRKAMPCLELARKCVKELRADQLRLGDVKAYFRAFGIFLEYLPNFEKHEEESKLLV